MTFLGTDSALTDYIRYWDCHLWMAEFAPDVFMKLAGGCWDCHPLGWQSPHRRYFYKIYACKCWDCSFSKIEFAIH